jgi:thiol-disulfide isomerase/thioredoxin
MTVEWAAWSRRLGTVLIASGLLAACGTSSPLASSTTTTPPTTATTTTTVPPTTTTTVAPKKKPIKKRPSEIRRAVGTAVYDDLATIPPQTLAAAARSLRPSGVLPTAIKGKSTPKVVVVGAEWCPYCAAENWSLVIALSQFGTFKRLSWTSSTTSSTELYRSIPGFTFYRSSYTSTLLHLSTVELATVAQRQLQKPTVVESRLMSKYDKLGDIPFLYLGGAAYVEGSGVSPKLLARHTFGGAANGIVQGTSSLARSVEGNAGVLVSYLCRLTHGQPGRVCRSFPKALTS